MLTHVKSNRFMRNLMLAPVLYPCKMILNEAPTYEQDIASNILSYEISIGVVAQRPNGYSLHSIRYIQNYRRQKSLTKKMFGRNGRNGLCS